MGETDPATLAALANPATVAVHAVHAVHAAAAAGDLDAQWALAGMLYADDRFAESRETLEALFRDARTARPGIAVRAAAFLAEIHHGTLGNDAVAHGWLARARRLLETMGPCLEWGYYELALMACDRPDSEDLLASAERALRIATEHGDAGLEIMALADSGLALVTQGRTAEGFARLDEALAAITAGDTDDLPAIGRAFCALLSSSERAGDVRRAEEWTRLVRERLLDPLGGRPRVLHTHCRAAYGAVLCSAGRWTEAESALLEALGPTASTVLGHRVESMARLADVRIQQGRLEEAAQLLAPIEDRLPAWRPLAELHLRRGEADLAAAVARRGLRELVGDTMRGAPLLATLVEAELCRGDVDAAIAATDTLAAWAGRTGNAVLRAQAGVAAGRVALAAGRPADAMAPLHDALAALGDEERPLLAGTARLELAHAHAGAGDEPAAVSDARAALATFERLSANPHADRALALLRRLGAPARAARPPGQPVAALATLTSREAEVLDLVRQGETNPQIGARLFISAKTVEHHVGRILTKLGVRTRAEAAALAAGAWTGAAPTPGTP